MTVKLSLLLVPPVLISFYFSIVKDVAWLLLSIVSLIIVIYILTSMIARIANKHARCVAGLAGISLLVVFELSRLASFYFQGESFNARFFFHFNWNSIFEAGRAFLPVMGIVLVYLFAVAKLSWSWFGKYHQRNSLSIPVQIVFLAVALFVLEPDISKFSARQIQEMVGTGEKLSAETIAWREMGLNPESLSQSIGQVFPGKNLVLIYLESLEEIYTDEQVFPGLTPHLNRLKQTGIVFNHMRQTEGTGWTIGGMVASQCGTPLLHGLGSGGNDILQNGFLNQAVCLGDILKQAGYYQVFLGGASTKFAGKGDFLANHGYDEVKGKHELSDLLEDSSYMSGWGLYDDSLFVLAAEKFERLAQAHQPFNLTLLTLDTHHPDGHASKSCPKYAVVANSMLDAVHCTDFLLNQFLESISKHPAWENTLVVLFSDHLAMRNVAQKYYPGDYDRQLLFYILNGGNMGEREINVTGTHMDVAPTLLHLMGVRHARHFLAGKNLMNAVQQPSTDILVSNQRLHALEYINRHLLTRLDNDLCENDHLVDVKGGIVRIGNHNISMNLSGQPVALDLLEFSHGLMAILDDLGKFDYALTFNLENLHHILYQYQSASFILIARTDYLPAFIKTGKEQEGEISILWKEPSGVINYLGGSKTPWQMAIKNVVCDPEYANKPVTMPPTTVKETSKNDLLEICRTGDIDGYYQESETGNIHLTRVAHENLWYSVSLSRITAEQYSITNLIPLEAIIPEAKPEYCHAYFGNSELLIPSLNTDKTRLAVIMQLIPETSGQLRITEKANRY